jgi:uncharacterized protein
VDRTTQVDPADAEPAHDIPSIVRRIRDDYVLPWDGCHGVHHWARVYENGIRIAEGNGADAEVVRLFALFHDARRHNEHRDHGHGARGADMALSLRGSLILLDDSRFEVLDEACRRHTDGATSSEPTLAACWDADRLDLGRVGITPQRRWLSTTAALDLRDWAHARATSFHVPFDTLTLWRATRDRPAT